MRKTVFVLLAFLLLFSHCSKKVVLNVTKPAKYNVSDLKRIAVLALNGPRHSGKFITGKVTNKLWQTQYFSVMERKEMQKILEEHALQMSGVISDSTAVEFGRLFGVNALVLGDVTNYTVSDKPGVEKVKEQVWTGEYEKDAKGNFIYEKDKKGKKVKKKKYKEQLVNKRYVQRSATVGLSFRMVSVETGEIRAGDSKTKSVSRKYYPDKGKLPEKKKILSDLEDQIIASWIPLKTPHKVRVSRTFEEDNDEVDLGIEMAQKNLWDKAIAIWEKEVQKNAGNSAALYNLGLAYEALGDLELAENYYDRALTVEPKDLYMEAISHIRARKKEQAELQKQLR